MWQAKAIAFAKTLQATKWLAQEDLDIIINKHIPI
jgi:hypothetical protein